MVLLLWGRVIGELLRLGTQAVRKLKARAKAVRRVAALLWESLVGILLLIANAGR